MTGDRDKMTLEDGCYACCYPVDIDPADDPDGFTKNLSVIRVWRLMDDGYWTSTVTCDTDAGTVVRDYMIASAHRILHRPPA